MRGLRLLYEEHAKAAHNKLHRWRRSARVASLSCALRPHSLPKQQPGLLCFFCFAVAPTDDVIVTSFWTLFSFSRFALRHGLKEHQARLGSDTRFRCSLHLYAAHRHT